MLLIGTAGMAAEPKPGIRIVDSDYYVSRLPQLLFDWADKDRFVFRGALAGERDPEELASPLIKVWDTTANVISPYKGLRHACLKSGRVWYSERGNDPAKTGIYIWWEGPLGEEKRHELQRTMRTKEETEYRFAVQAKNPFSCKLMFRDELDPPATDDSRELVALREGDGYLDMGSRSIDSLVEERKRGVAVRWIHPRFPLGRSLGIPLAEEPTVTGYSGLRQFYMIYVDLGVPGQLTAARRWAERVPHRYYLFDARDGSVSHIDVPNFGPASGVGRLAPTKVGWVFSGSATPWRRRSGLYIYDGVSVTMLEWGLVSELQVSPDGCKAAYVVNTEAHLMGTPYRVKYVDFCGKLRSP